VFDTTFSREFTMAHQPQDQTASKKDAEKKQPETVLLTAEELRSIAGGNGGIVNTSPNPKPPPVPK
jgi:hypothetical protein